MAKRDLLKAFENLSDSSLSDDNDDEPPAKRPRPADMYFFGYCYSTAYHFRRANVETLARMCAECCSKHQLAPAKRLALVFGDRMFCTDGDLALLLLLGLTDYDPVRELPDTLDRHINELKTSSMPLRIFGPLVHLFPAVRKHADPRGFIDARVLVDKLLALGFVSSNETKPDDLVLQSPLVNLSKPYFYC